MNESIRYTRQAILALSKSEPNYNEKMHAAYMQLYRLLYGGK